MSQQAVTEFMLMDSTVASAEEKRELPHHPLPFNKKLSCISTLLCDVVFLVSHTKSRRHPDLN